MPAAGIYEQLGAGGLTVEGRLTYERQLLMRVRGMLLFNRFGKKAGIPTRGGRSVSWRGMRAIDSSTTALTEGTPGAGIRGTFREVQATVNQYGQFALLSDVAISQTIDEIMPEYTENFAEAQAESLDILTRNVIDAGTTIQYASTAASRGGLSSGMYFNSAEIREALTTLKRNNAKPVDSGKYVCFYNVDAWPDLMSDTNIVNAMQYAANRGSDNPLFSGQMPDYLGCRFFETTLARIYTSLGLSGANVYEALFVGQEAYGVVDYDKMPAKIFFKPLGSAGTDDPLDQVASVGYKAAHAAARLNEDFIVRLEHITSRSNSS